MTAIPFRDVDASVAEIERCAALGHRGILVTGEPQVFGLPLLGDATWDPLWRVASETGIGFIPFLLEAADYAFGEAAMRIEWPEFELLPSEYFHRQVYGCWFFEETAPQRLVDKIGAADILFETDCPHPICLYGNVREKIDAALGGQPPELRRQLLWDNAAALYRVADPVACGGWPGLHGHGEGDTVVSHGDH